ncbi:MAG: DUF4976 domain-containing protein, partial [Phycisphaerales bacterium]|nr:DUF4976 domain-containing protein [Phycisphaerales bacterium]
AVCGVVGKASGTSMKNIFVNNLEIKTDSACAVGGVAGHLENCDAEDVIIVNTKIFATANSVGGLASHIDICPTILDHFGLPVPKSLQGRSMIPELANPSQPTNKTDKVFVTFNRFEIDLDGFGGLHPMRAVITDRFKLAIHLLESTDELYDRENDPYDMHNLIGDPAYANVRAELHDAILACMADTRDPFRGYQWANRPWRSARAPSWHDGNRSRNRETEDAYEPRQLDYEDGLPLRKNVR